MCKLQRLLACIAMLLVASGCATSSVDKSFSLAQHPQDGIIAVSVTHDLHDVLGRSNAIFYFENTGPKPDGLHGQLQSRAESFPGISKRSEFSDANGRLLVLSLRQGDYEFTSWQIGNGSVYFYPRKTPPALQFHVKAGQVEYLGDLHGHLMFGKNIFGLPVLAGGYPEIQDARARDIPILYERFPQFRGKVTIELLTLGPWASPSPSTR